MAFTFFFRDRHTLDLLAQNLTESKKDSLKVWDAGCAMGPEPYTFSIIMSEQLPADKFKNLKIVATDIDESGNFGEIVTKGVYPKNDVSRMPEDLFKKYFFSINEKDYQLIDSIKNSVTYHWHDLLSLKPIESGFDAVICKNVLLHLQPKERIEVLKMFATVLKPHGYLVTEQTQAMPEECNHLFSKIVTDANLFQKK